MSIFPEIAPDYGYTLASKYQTLTIGPPDSLYIQRRRLSSVGRMEAELTWSSLTDAQEFELQKFFEARSGAYESFVFYSFVKRIEEARIIGTGNGSQSIWTLGHRDIENYTVYFDGIVRSKSYYRIGNRTGAEGEDQLIFNTVPASTLVITMDYSGYKKYGACIFAEDTFASVRVGFNRSSVRLKIVEVSG